MDEASLVERAFEQAEKTCLLSIRRIIQATAVEGTLVNLPVELEAA